MTVLVIFVVLASSRIIAGGRVRAVALRHKQSIQERRLVLYLKLLALLRHSMPSVDPEDGPSVRATEQDLILLGSEKVIAAYLKWRQLDRTDRESCQQSLAELLIAMRKDLFWKNAIEGAALRNLYEAGV